MTTSLQEIHAARGSRWSCLRATWLPGDGDGDGVYRLFARNMISFHLHA